MPKSARTDVSVIDHGTIVTALPETSKAKRYVKRHLASATHVGGAVAIEHRYAFDILAGMVAAGLTLGKVQ